MTRVFFGRPSLTLVLALLLVPLPAASQPRPPAGSATAEFEALLALVKKSDPSVDFARLRRVYSESDSFVPYRDDAEDSMIDAVSQGQHKAALGIATEILARNYMNIEAHFASLVACKALDDAACANHHIYVARGIIDSILASGDGKTQETAYVVVAVPEEYALTRVFGLRVTGQSLVKGKDDHSYDVLTVKEGEKGEEQRMYFNIDLSLAATARVFGLSLK